MKIKYRLLLTHGLLVLLALFIVLVNAIAYQSIKDDSEAINNLGRLRALSYNMGRIASELDNSESGNDPSEMRRELAVTKEEFESTLTGFDRIKSVKNSEVWADLKAIERKWERLFEPGYVRIIDNTATEAEYTLLNYNIDLYVQEINTMVARYSNYSGDKVYGALVINAFLVIILAATSIYSFKTMNAHVRKPILLLMNELKELSNIDDDFAKRLYSIDVDEITEMAQHFNVMIYDQLTGTYNRRSGLSKLRRVINNDNRRQLGISLCFVDINGLKEVNDSLGHKSGDELIISTAECIKSGIRENDFVIRMGGDEFLIVLDGVDMNEAEKVWGRIKESYNRINDFENRPYLVSVSHGIVEYDNALKPGLEDLIKAADEKMYDEKKSIKKELKESIVRAGA